MSPRATTGIALRLAPVVAGLGVALAACGSGPVVATQGGATTVSTETTIWIDASAQLGANPHFWSASIGTGTASMTLRGDLQTQYKIGQREAGFQRVRGHGVLNDDMGIYQGPGAYDWTNLDQYLTAIAAAQMRPIMEMDFMPSALALNGDSHDIYKNAADYRRFIAAVVQHCVDRFGMADVSRWYWEIWNEPDYAGFWRGKDVGQSTSAKMDDYYALYDNAVAAITSVIPDALVGGPGASNVAAVPGFLQHCKKAGTRVTFVSSHHYPGGAGDGRTADASQLVSDNDTRLSAISAAGYSTAQVMSFNTEWNSSYSGQGGGTGDPLLSMDNHWNVGFILKAAKVMSDRNVAGTPPLSVFSYWVLSDVFNEWPNTYTSSTSYILGHDEGQLPFGSVFGLMTAQGVRKAAFNAFKMLNRLGPVRLQSSGGADSDGVDAMATRSQAGDEIQILVYDQYGMLNTAGTDKVTINLYNIPASLAGKPLFVTRFLVDESHSNPNGVWREQGSPANPTEAQWQAMRAAQHLAVVSADTATIGGSYTTTFSIGRQSGTLLTLGLARPSMGRDAFAPIEGEDYDGQSAAWKRGSGDDDLGLAVDVAGGGSLFYDVVDFGDRGVDSVALRMQARTATSVQLHADAATGPLLGTCPIGTTARNWATTSCPLAHTSGVHTLVLVFPGSASLNWLRFQ
jgi:xylan 1,4-beta-xylosidase